MPSFGVVTLDAVDSLQRLVVFARCVAEEEARQRARLKALQSILKLADEIKMFDAKIQEFEGAIERDNKNTSAKAQGGSSSTNAKPQRFRGRSTHFLEEEKFRKHAAKRYPWLLQKLATEVKAWEGRFGEPIDLAALGGLLFILNGIKTWS